MIKFEDFFKIDFPNVTKVKFNMNDGDLPAWDLLKSSEDDEKYKRWVRMNAWKSESGQANNNLNRAKYLLSFAQYYTLGAQYYIFGGFYKVEQLPEVKSGEGYKLTLLDEFKEYRRRLIIKLEKPIGRDIYNKPFNNVQRDFNAEIYEIRPSVKLDNFIGFNRVLLKHSELQYIFKNDAPEWKNNLSSVKGIYCITDISNGQLYIGSASGEGGIWQRWQQYANVNDLTGGNTTFEKIKNNGAEHIIDNFTYSILEIFDIRTDKHVILERESFWKNVFKSKIFGMNEN